MVSSEEAGESPVLESTETDVPRDEHRPSLTEDQRRSMKAILDALYSYRDADGHDPSKMFHKRVNRRNIPTYYEVIKEPMALSNLKARLHGREYKFFGEFVRDCALIWHNAHTYNRPESGAYIDASTMKGVMEREFQKLVDQKLVGPEEASWPDLGEIPPVEDAPAEAGKDGAGEDDEEEDEDEDEADESDEEGGKRQRRGGRRSSAAIVKREPALQPGGKKKRGRPPKVDTPMEARIKNILKGIRKPKNPDGGIIIYDFEKLPEKTTLPDYYLEIERPMAIEQIKKAQKRKRYKSLDQFMADIDLMFNNAKKYNEDESQIHKNAVYLQNEAHRLAEIEKKKDDSEFVMDEGRKPKPDGIVHNDELWKVGDWIHIQNPNDVTKPIVAQIYRTWGDARGQEWVNACWYYRPEQTVHQYEKHFFPDEVVKTGQYRDHRIEEVIGRCFVMFVTRYLKGRPTGISAGTDVYVCEARYNEEKHKMNKIKTWASCLPDEVRDKDYEWAQSNSATRKLKKLPSPLLHLLKDDAKDADVAPEPRWGAVNAPPVVGGIFKGPRDENQSPPPEPTPSPPPQPPPPPPRQVSQAPIREAPTYRRQSDVSAAMDEATRAFGVTAPPVQQPQASYVPQPLAQRYQSSVSPAPPQYQQQPIQPASYAPPAPGAAFAAPIVPSYIDHFSTPQSRYPQQQRPVPGPAASGQRHFEAFHLPDQANLSIPEDIRDQFQQDEQGRVLFFSRPPLDIRHDAQPGQELRHSLKYRASKIRQHLEAEKKREREATGVQDAEPKRRRKTALPQEQHRTTGHDPAIFEAPATAPSQSWAEQMNDGTDAIWRSIYGEKWREGRRLEMQKLVASQEAAQDTRSALDERERAVKDSDFWTTRKLLKGPDVYLDDIDPRY